MVKKQVDFQMASYTYSASDPDRLRMREEVKAMQANGWEVIKVVHGGVRHDENARPTDVFFVALAKYEWVEEPEPKKASKAK